jgi:hypothetical protein
MVATNSGLRFTRKGSGTGRSKSAAISAANREHPFWREFVEYANDAKVIAILDYLVFAMANSELLVPEQASIVKTNVNSTLVGLLV